MEPVTLLHEISSITKKYDLLYQKTGGYFNIFEIANIATDELSICRVLYELLSPTGMHYQKTAYLKIFFEIVLKIEISDKELMTARVFREYSLDNQRRIDLVIETSNRLVPIEVKIFAEDQKKQCYDYFQKARNSNVYYLTLFGDLPSESSAAGLTKIENGYDEVSCISFAVDILNWLDLCVKQTTTLKIAPIREVIFQLMSVIRQFTNQMEGDEEMEIKDLLMKSSEHMRSAIAIENSIDEAKKEIILKLFKAIESKVDTPKLVNEYDYAADDFKKISEFYRYNRSSYPGISYLYKSNIKESIDIWVRVEIDWRIYIGYCCVIDGQAGKQSLTEKEIKNILNVEPCIDDWWLYWEFLPVDNEIECPNFKSLNEEYFKLYDDESFNKFVDVSVQKIKKLLNNENVSVK